MSSLLQVQQLLPQLALRLGELVVDGGGLLLERLCGLALHDAEILDGALAAGPLGRQPIAQRLELLLHELLERRQTFLHVVFQLGGVFDKALFQPREALVVVAHLDAEEDVADLVDAGAAGQGVGGDIGLA